MGTRNLTCVVKGGEFRVAQYCQWDGYPSGQGQTITEFVAKRLRTKKGLAKFSEQVDRIQVVDENYVRKLYNDLGITGEWMTLEEAARFKRLHPEFDRDFGANILEFVRVAKEPPKVSLSVDFAGDSLFCEWAYVIDLDKGTFEVYQGFNKKPLRKGERFYPYFHKADPDQTQYYPVRLWRSFPLERVTKKLGDKLQKEYSKEAENE